MFVKTGSLSKMIIIWFASAHIYMASAQSVGNQFQKSKTVHYFWGCQSMHQPPAPGCFTYPYPLHLLCWQIKCCQCKLAQGGLHAQGWDISSTKDQLFLRSYGDSRGALGWANRGALKNGGQETHTHSMPTTKLDNFWAYLLMRDKILSYVIEWIKQASMCAFQYVLPCFLISEPWQHIELF